MGNTPTRGEWEVLGHLHAGADLELGPMIRVTIDGDQKGWTTWPSLASCLGAGWVVFDVNRFCLTDEGREVMKERGVNQ